MGVTKVFDFFNTSGDHYIIFFEPVELIADCSALSALTDAIVNFLTGSDLSVSLQDVRELWP